MLVLALQALFAGQQVLLDVFALAMPVEVLRDVREGGVKAAVSCCRSVMHVLEDLQVQVGGCDGDHDGPVSGWRDLAEEDAVLEDEAVS